MNKTWHIHTMEHQSLMEEDKVLTQAMTWVKLEEKAKYVTEGKKKCHRGPHICKISFYMKYPE